MMFTIPITKVRLLPPTIDLDNFDFDDLDGSDMPVTEEETLIAFQGKVMHSFEVSADRLPAVLYTSRSYQLHVEVDPKMISGDSETFAISGEVCSIIPEEVTGAGENGDDLKVYTVHLANQGRPVVSLALDYEQVSSLRFGQQIGVTLRPAT